MQFTYGITINPNTERQTPKRERTKLCYGKLKRVQIDFPWGCAGLVHIRILHYEHQLYPTNPHKWFIGNEISIVFECDYPITQGWNEFKIEGYNEDDFDTHTPIVNFNVLPFAGQYSARSLWIEGQRYAKRCA